MVLAADLNSPQGRMILGKGQEITDKILRVCKIWGVTEADVEGATADQAQAEKLKRLDPSILQAAKAIISRQFAQANRDHEAVRELMKISILRHVARLTAEGVEKVVTDFARTRIHVPARDESAPPPKPPTLEAILGNKTELASLPDIFHQIIDALKNPNSSANFVADIIGKDTSLSAKLLKLVNSSFYGFPNKVDTLSRAVTITGLNQLTNLALGISVINGFKGIPPEILDMTAFWRHSVACGILARALAGQMRLPGEERFFVAGMLHDIGRLVMFRNYPALAREALTTAAEKKIPVTAAEAEVWGFTHAALAGGLLREWKFPVTLENAIHRHHNPLSSRSPQEPAVLHVADVVAHALAIGSSGTRLVPPLIPEAWDTLGLSRNVLAALAPQVDQQVEDIMRAFAV
jgi:HD-like signal output (HDOD) protein